MSFNLMSNAHIDFNTTNLSHNFSFGGNHYQDDTRLRQGGIHADVFPPYGNGFRTAAGIWFPDDGLSGTSMPTDDTYTFAGRRPLVLPGIYAAVEARYPTVMPYSGTGYGHQPTSKGFGFIVNIGVVYSTPKFSYTLSP